MANIRNLQILKTFSNFFKLKASDSFGDVVGRMIVPVVNTPIPPAQIRQAGATESDGTSATIITTSLTADTFLVAMNLTVAKDVNSTSIISNISGTVQGQSGSAFLTLRYEPLTVASGLISNLALPFPLLLARGTTVTVTNSNGTASIDTTARIYFYEIED